MKTCKNFGENMEKNVLIYAERWCSGGIESLISNLVSNLDKSKFNIKILVSQKETSIYDDLLDNIKIEEILKDDTKKLTLKSLFIIPGKHVIDDILNSNDSWSEKIKSKGIEITIGKKSLLQYEKIREMYITKINNVIRNIK